MQRVEVKDPSLPRMLVMGDSISMGYRNDNTQHFQGRAYVDYWVGSGCRVLAETTVSELKLVRSGDTSMWTLAAGEGQRIRGQVNGR